MFVRTCFISSYRQRQHAIFPELIPQRAGIISAVLYFPFILALLLKDIILLFFRVDHSAGTISATDRQTEIILFSADIIAV